MCILHAEARLTASMLPLVILHTVCSSVVQVMAGYKFQQHHKNPQIPPATPPIHFTADSLKFNIHARWENNKQMPCYTDTNIKLRYVELLST